MHIEGFKYHEIADKLGLKIGTLKQDFLYTPETHADIKGL